MWAPYVYLVLLEEVDEHVDVAVRDAVDDLAVVLHQLHHHLRRVQPDLALRINTAPSSHVVCRRCARRKACV